MDAAEFQAKINEAFNASGWAPQHPVVMIDKETGATSSIKGVRHEIHEEGGGTFWIEVEGN